jgi:hypothetical protein
VRPGAGPSQITRDLPRSSFPVTTRRIGVQCHARLYRLAIRLSHELVIDLHGLQKARDQVVGADRRRQLDQLARVEVRLSASNTGAGTWITLVIEVGVGEHRRSAASKAFERLPVAQRVDLLPAHAVLQGERTWAWYS